MTAVAGKTVLLRLDGRRRHHGYKGVEVLDEPLSTDVAVLAALAVLEASESTKQALKRLTAILRAEGGGSLGETVHDDGVEIILTALAWTLFGYVLWSGGGAPAEQPTRVR